MLFNNKVYPFFYWDHTESWGCKQFYLTCNWMLRDNYVRQQKFNYFSHYDFMVMLFILGIVTVYGYSMTGIRIRANKKRCKLKWEAILILAHWMDCGISWRVSSIIIMRNHLIYRKVHPDKLIINGEKT